MELKNAEKIFIPSYFKEYKRLKSVISKAEQDIVNLKNAKMDFCNIRHWYFWKD